MSNGIFAETLAGYTEHRTYYDGQMPLEESVTTSGNTTLTQNFIGARGLEAMTTKVGNSTPITSYPLYDVHGNMVATVQKGSSGTSWTIHDERSNDVWGSVRSGIATGGPRGRYCANLGHVQDDESGLVYMRARYYEPGTGRFISEDSAMDGSNWYAYCSGDPANHVDPSGNSAKATKQSFAGAWAAVGFFVYFASIFFAASMNGHDITAARITYFGVRMVLGVLTAEALIMWDKSFPVLNKAAKSFAKLGGSSQRTKLQIAFYVGYGLFIALLIDMIDMMDDHFDYPSLKQLK